MVHAMVDATSDMRPLLKDSYCTVAAWPKVSGLFALIYIVSPDKKGLRSLNPS